MEHLALEVFDLATPDNPNPTGSQYAVLSDDASITITATSEIFASGDVWSFPFTLNVNANAHLFGTAGEIHGSRLHEQINKRKARLWAEGLPLYLGYLKLDDEAEVDADGNVDISLESGQKTFEEMIEGAKANQVPMLDDVLIGMALWRKRWTRFSLGLKASVQFADGATASAEVWQNGNGVVDGVDFVTFQAEGENEETPLQQYPRMVFPKGDFRQDVAATGSHGSSGGSFSGSSGNNPSTPTGSGSGSTGNFGGSISNQDSGKVHVDCLNTDYPYTEDANGVPSHPFCNIALCYQKYGYKKTDEQGHEETKYDEEPVAQRGYEYMPANRVNSAPNFYVLYWLRCLMEHLNIHIDENQMMDVEDLRRLFFVNTNCAYEEPKNMRTGTVDSRYGKYSIKRGGVRGDQDYIPERVDEKPVVKLEDSALSCTGFTQGEPSGHVYPFSDLEKTITKVTVDVADIKKWNGEDGRVAKSTDDYLAENCFFSLAIASSDCFPNVEVSEVIRALESGFGVRFLFDGNYQRVRIVLLRNIFRSSQTQVVSCEIVDEDVKVENNKRGFRMTYGNTEDTHFYYKGFADMLPHKKELWIDKSDKHDYSHWNLNAEYGAVINKVSAFDKTCYVTPNTGNAYIIKVDKDAKRIKELYQSLFEGAGYMDAEDGDCTGEEETIETVTVGFTPAIMNDLNMDEERKDSSLKKQKFALFVDETMRPRREDLKDLPNETQPGVKSYNDSDASYDINKLYEEHSDKMAGGIVKPGEFSITSDMSVKADGLHAEITRTKYYADKEPDIIAWDLAFNIGGSVSEGYRLYLQDNFEPNDDGVSPIESHDWGLTLGVMRGSGDDAKVDYSDDPEDDVNDTWEIVPGSSVTAHPDTCDCYGQEWDYNGAREGTDDGNNGRVSTPEDAIAMLATMFPASNAKFYLSGYGYIKAAMVVPLRDENGVSHTTVIVHSHSTAGPVFRKFADLMTYVGHLEGHTTADMMRLDAAGYNGVSNVIVEIDSTQERSDTMLKLCRIAYGGSSETITIDNGIDIRDNRFSLKLRAEKPNPYYVAGSDEDGKRNQYLTITNQNLQQRGLADQFFKEYSYFVRHARIVQRKVCMTLAQLLTIDKTVRVTIGDVTGFVRKLQYTVSNQTGLGIVTVDIMYI